MKGYFMKKAFTLAEVLITLTIIGVVAAMTIPTLVQNYKKIETASRLKNFYSMMTQAIKMSEIDNDDALMWAKSEMLINENNEVDYDNQNLVTKSIFDKYIEPYIKYVKYVDGTVSTDEENNNKFNRPTVYLGDGSSFTLYNGACMDFEYDINGNRNPNVGGKDIFTFLLCLDDERRFSYFNNKNIVFNPYSDFRIIGLHDKLLEKCTSDYRYCASLIMCDGWEIKEDYPYKL